MNSSYNIPLILPAEPFRPDAPRISELNNGIKLYAFPRGDQDIVKIDVVFSAGTVHQPLPLISLLTGKLLKEGTASFNSSHIAYQLDFHGAYLEFSNGHHHSVLSLYCLNRHLSKLLPLLASIVREPVFPEKEFEVTLENRKQEFLINEQKVKILASKMFNKHLWGEKHPYAQHAQINDFDGLTTENLKAFYRGYYTPARCTIFVSGNANDGVIDIIDKYLCVGWNVENTTPNITFSPAEPNAGTHIVTREGVQSAIKAGRHIMKRGDEIYPSFQLLNGVFGGYFGSRLMKNIREDKGYTYGISSYIVSQPLGTYMTIQSETANEYRTKVMEELVIEMKRLQQEKVPEAELQMVKNYLSGELMRSFDGPFAIADIYRSLWEDDLNFDFIENYLEKMEATTSETVRNLACKWLNPDDLVTAIVGAED